MRRREISILRIIAYTTILILHNFFFPPSWLEWETLFQLFCCVVRLILAVGLLVMEWRIIIIKIAAVVMLLSLSCRHGSISLATSTRDQKITQYEYEYNKQNANWSFCQFARSTAICAELLWIRFPYVMRSTVRSCSRCLIASVSTQITVWLFVLAKLNTN